MVDTTSHEVELHYAYNFQAQLLLTLLSTCAFHAGFVLPLCFCVSTTCIYFLHATDVLRQQSHNGNDRVTWYI